MILMSKEVIQRFAHNLTLSFNVKLSRFVFEVTILFLEQNNFKLFLWTTLYKDLGAVELEILSCKNAQLCCFPRVSTMLMRPSTGSSRGLPNFLNVSSRSVCTVFSKVDFKCSGILMMWKESIYTG